MKSNSMRSKENEELAETGMLDKFKNKNIILGIGLVGIILVISYFFKGVFLAATVNGQPISRLSVIQKLEKQGGKNILDSLVTDTLIKSEAKKKGIVISEDEINQEIKTIEATVTQQGGTLEQALLQQGMTKESLKENVKNQKIIEKLIADKIKVTDAEVNKYIVDNQTSIEEGKEAETKKQIMDQLKQQKFQQEAQLWVASLKTAANIKYYVNY
jgi:foldase protein PrsA